MDQRIVAEQGRNEAGLPVRLVSRLTTEFALMNMQQSLRLVPGRLETSIVAQSLIRCALPQLVGPRGLMLPTSRPLIGSISSVARSFDRSPETIRRHVHLLTRKGFFAVERDGVRLSLLPDAGARTLVYLQRTHDNMLWLVEELDSWGVVRRRASRGDKGSSLERILRTALDLRLFAFETFHGPLGGWTSLSIWNALSGASVRHVTANRRLSSEYIQRSTPDSLRRPISVRALCSVSGLPYATVWRHLASLEEAGKVGRRGDGYVMLTGQLRTTDMEARVVQYVVSALSRVDRLLSEGLDPEDIPSLYIGPRPALVPLR